MAKRGYKLQEFLAHSGNVNCLNIGKKACRHFITGGDDHKVNVWAIGKPTALTSLSGHTSPVESTAFDSAEVLVLAGASSGVIKQWDLEEAKMVRTLSGHRSNCTAVEFHPFGEFFASGSMDTNLRIWDIRKKGCIHTYKGHTQGISTIKFTPDGRWVVSGGNDNVVKVWDLTAGKLLHDFKFHEGHIRSLDFHPLEFLLATGSSDRTVKFWDLETFELIGSTRPEATGVRAITFHPDGRTLFTGLEESLKVHSWEPVICHDAVDMGWSTLGDLCIHEGKLLGCSYYQNSIGVWVVDISLIEPYGDASQNDHTDQKFNLKLQENSEGVGIIGKHSNVRCRSPDYDTKEIKNIYVDSSGGKPVISQKIESLTPPKVPSHSDKKEISDQLTKKQSCVLGTPPKPSDHVDKSFVVRSIVPRDSPDGKDSVDSASESITFSRTKRGMLLRPAHVKRSPNSKNDVEKVQVAIESCTLGNKLSSLDGTTDSNCQIKTVSEDTKVEPCEEKNPIINCVTERFEKVSSPQTPNSQEASKTSPGATKSSSSVKVVNGVAVVRGRTRSLVERFEKREQLSTNDDQVTVVSSPVVPEVDKTPPVQTEEPQVSKRDLTSVNARDATDQISRRDLIDVNARDATDQVSRRDINARDATGQVSKRDLISANARDDNNQVSKRDLIYASSRDSIDQVPKRDLTPADARDAADQLSQRDLIYVNAREATTNQVSKRDLIYVNPRDATDKISKKDLIYVNARDTTDQVSKRDLIYVKARDANQVSRRDVIYVNALDASDQVSKRDLMYVNAREAADQVSKRDLRSANARDATDQVSETDSITSNARDTTEDLMQTHDVFLSTLRSRLTKLQVVRHFWERRDIKGAIGAMRKLPDHSVQADVISVLMEKMDTLTLDMFSILLPVLLGLLDSKTDRHAILSLEMLLKLVAVFGPVIRSTVSARRSVGVDLHAEQRKECCNQCSAQLQKIQKILPSLVRKGGLVAKSAMELNLVLQES